MQEQTEIKKNKHDRGLKSGINLEASRQKREDVSIKLRQDKQQRALTDIRKESKHNDGSGSFNTSFLISDIDRESMENEQQTRNGIKELCDKIRVATSVIINVNLTTNPMPHEYMASLANMFNELENKLYTGGMVAEHEIVKQDITSNLVSCFLVPSPTYELLAAFLDVIYSLSAGQMGEVADFMKYPIVGYLIGTLNISNEKLQAFDKGAFSLYLSISSRIMDILANFVLESSIARDTVIKERALQIAAERFIPVFNSVDDRLKKALARFTGCMLRIKPLPDYQVVKDVHQVMKMFYDTNDSEIVEQYMSVFYNIMLSDDESCHIIVLNDPMLEYTLHRLITTFKDPSDFPPVDQCDIRRYSLMVIAQMIMRGGQDVDELIIGKFIYAGIIQALMETVNKSVQKIDADVFYLFSLISMNDNIGVSKIIECGVLSDSFLSRVKAIKYFDLEKHMVEIFRSVVNTVADDLLIELFTNNKIITAKLVEMVACMDAGVQQTCLACIKELLFVGSKAVHFEMNPIKVAFEKADLPHMLIACEEKVKNAAVSSMAAEIMSIYFETFERNDTLQGSGMSEFKFKNMFEDDTSLEDFQKLKSQIFKDIGKMYNERYPQSSSSGDNDSKMNDDN